MDAEYVHKSIKEVMASSKKKIKVFLGAYVNQTNAQNLNCLELARHLDKNRFEVYTLTIKHGNLGEVKSTEFNTFDCRFPVKLTAYLGFFWGIYKCDVAYLPRGNNYKYCRFLLKLFKRKSFKQIERVIDRDNPEKFSQILKNLKEIRANYFYTTRTYGISRYIRDYSSEHFDFPMQKDVLHVPVNVEPFVEVSKIRTQLRQIVLIGNELVRKGVLDFLQIAERIPSLRFHVIGRDSKGLVKDYISNKGLQNVVYHGMLRFSEMSEVLKKIDLHLLLSKSEGFGKVTIECAAAGIPSIVYDTYGAEEWIENNVNGMIRATIEEVEEAIVGLIETPGYLKQLSENSLQMPEKFLPERVVKKYEEVILELAS